MYSPLCVRYPTKSPAVELSEPALQGNPPKVDALPELKTEHLGLLPAKAEDLTGEYLGIVGVSLLCPDDSVDDRRTPDPT